MTTDTIFNIASMTKPMTTVGALMLYEQGKLLIDDPLSQIFPEIRQHARRRARRQGEPTADTVPANRQITIQDLMRHTSGIDLWRPRQYAGAQDVSGRQRRCLARL